MNFMPTKTMCSHLSIDVFHTGLSNKQLLASGEDLVTLLLGKIDFERRKIDWEDRKYCYF